jgi:FkbM family methyltransferase
MDKATIRYQQRLVVDHEIVFHDLLETGMNMDKHIIAGTAFQRPDHNFQPLLRLVKKGSVVYDLGSYIGTFAIPMAIEGMEVHAFEGFPDNYERCKKNTEPYNVTNYQVAVSNENYTVDSKFNNCMDNEYEVRTIKYVRLDEYVKKNKIPAPSLVKMDIEGMETLALHGMTNLLENVRPIWSMGYHFKFYSTVEGYPGWIDVKDGGFDFKRFTELEYIIFDELGRRAPPHILDIRGGEFTFIPREKIKAK